MSNQDFNQTLEVNIESQFYPSFLKTDKNGLTAVEMDSSISSLHGLNTKKKKKEDWTIKKLKEVITLFPMSNLLFSIAKQWIQDRDDIKVVQFVFDSLFK